MKKKQAFIFLICLNMAVQAFSQDTCRCYEYKILYNEDKDLHNDTLLGGIKYYDGQMHLIKSLSLGPEKNDSCWTNYQYDVHGNLVKETGGCSDTRVEEIRECKYRYDKDSRMLREESIQYKPFFELSNTVYERGSTIKTFYTSKQDRQQNNFEWKYVDIHNTSGNTVRQFQINNMNDTTSFKKYLYFPIADTLTVRSNIKHLNKPDRIIFMNGLHQEEVIDYYDDNNKYEGSTIKKYNENNKIILEQVWSQPKNRIIFETEYTYDASGALFQKKDKDIDAGITKVYTYDMDKLIREDYVYGGVLNISIVYKFETSSSPISFSSLE